MQKRLFDDRIAMLRETKEKDADGNTRHYFDLVNDLGQGLIHSSSCMDTTRETFEKAIKKSYELENVKWED